MFPFFLWTFIVLSCQLCSESSVSRHVVRSTDSCLDVFVNTGWAPINLSRILLHGVSSVSVENDFYIVIEIIVVIVILIIWKYHQIIYRYRREKNINHWNNLQGNIFSYGTCLQYLHLHYSYLFLCLVLYCINSMSFKIKHHLW